MQLLEQELSQQEVGMAGDNHKETYILPFLRPVEVGYKEEKMALWGSLGKVGAS